jgi:hypothetical protein
MAREEWNAKAVKLEKRLRNFICFIFELPLDYTENNILLKYNDQR